MLQLKYENGRNLGWIKTLVSLKLANFASEYALSWTYKWGSGGFSEKGQLWFSAGSSESRTSSSCLLFKFKEITMVEKESSRSLK